MMFTTLSSRFAEAKNGILQRMSDRVRPVQQFAARVGDRIKRGWQFAKAVVWAVNSCLEEDCESPESLIGLAGCVAYLCATPFVLWAVWSGVYALVTTMLPFLALAGKAATIGFLPIALLSYLWKLWQWMQLPENRMKAARFSMSWTAFFLGVCVVAAIFSALVLELNPFVYFWNLSTIGGGLTLVVFAIWYRAEEQVVRIKHSDFAKRAISLVRSIRNSRNRELGIAYMERADLADRQADLLAEAIAEEQVKPGLPEPKKYRLLHLTTGNGSQVCLQEDSGTETAMQLYPVEGTILVDLRDWFGVKRSRDLAGKTFWSLYPTVESVLNSFNSGLQILSEEDVESYRSMQEQRVEEPTVEETSEDNWGLSTCLNEDQQNCIRHCPGCVNYHGYLYGKNLLVCGIHPYGMDEHASECPDYRAHEIQIFDREVG